MENELYNQAHLEHAGTASKCPRCGGKTLYREELPDGRIETRCLARECSYTQVGSSQSSDPLDDFTQRISRMDTEQLKPLVGKLERSCQSLTGRACRVAQRQLTIVTGELQKRILETPPKPEEKVIPESPGVNASPKATPAQFMTPQAHANRVKGIREHYQRRKSGLLAINPSSSLPPNRWFDTLLKTLQDEAARHEQAAHHYARVPDLSSLHIDHSARAFELNRVIDMLSNHIKMVFPEIGPGP